MTSAAGDPAERADPPSGSEAPTCASSLAGQGLRHLAAGPFDLFECVYHAALETREHAHEATCLVFCLDGEMQERQGALVGELRRDNLLVLPAGVVHADSVGHSGCRCLLVVMSDFPSERLGDDRRILERASLTHDWRLARLGWSIYRELVVQDVGSSLAAEGLVLQLLACLGREAPPIALSAPGWLRALRDRLHAEPEKPFSLADLAATAGVHPGHVVRAFTAAFGMSPSRYLRKLRVDLAAAAIATTDAPLSRIGTEAGYYDQSHFTRLFRREMGMTPRDYRRASHGM